MQSNHIGFNLKKKLHVNTEVLNDNFRTFFLCKLTVELKIITCIFTDKQVFFSIAMIPTNNFCFEFL